MRGYDLYLEKKKKKKACSFAILLRSTGVVTNKEWWLLYIHVSKRQTAEIVFLKLWNRVFKIVEICMIVCNLMYTTIINVNKIREQ